MNKNEKKIKKRISFKNTLEESFNNKQHVFLVKLFLFLSIHHQGEIYCLLAFPVTYSKNKFQPSIIHALDEELN